MPKPTNPCKHLPKQLCRCLPAGRRVFGQGLSDPGGLPGGARPLPWIADPHLPASDQVSYEDVNRLKKFGVLEKARIPHFMQDLERYMKQLDHIVATNGLNEEELEQLLPD